MRALLFLALTACRVAFDPTDPEDVPMTDVAITITGAGSGAIRVKTDAGEVPCATTCTVPVGATVHFIPEASEGSWFRGWTVGCDAGRRPCDLVANEPIAVTADFSPEPNRIFMSSQTHDGALLPTAGDAFCQQLATRANLAGTYKVLLTTTTGSWPTRIPGARGFIRVDGQPVADDIALIDHRIMAAITVDETGAYVPAGSFWGVHSGNTGQRCNDWISNAAGTTGTVIDTQRGSNYQSGGGAAGCDTQAHVICAGSDRNVPVAPVPDPGRKAFTTDGVWAASSGLAAADALCMSEAGSAGFPGSFKALLAMPGASALSRFDLTKSPWIRVDGTPLLPTAAAWATAEVTDASFHLTPSGMYVFYGLIAASNDVATPGTVATTCDGWTSSTGSSGRPFWTWETKIRPTPQTNFCGSLVKLLCFEE